MREVPQLVDPSEFPYERYYSSLIGRNTALHSTARARLNERGFLESVEEILLQQGSGSAQRIEVLTTGSDGRGEKGPRSPIDIIVLLSRHIGESAREAVGQILGDSIKLLSIEDQVLREQILAHPDFEGVEVKNLKNGPLYRFHGRDGDHAIWPNRLIDTTPLIKKGPSLLSEAKGELWAEYKEDGRKILEIERSRRRRYAVTCRGKEGDRSIIGTNRKGGKELRHFDLDEGIATYDPDNELGSFKHGPLRLVQVALSCSIGHAIYVESANERLIQDCPGNTVNKMHFLREQGVIKASFRDVSEYADLYKYFLWLYHQSEFVFRTSGVTQHAFDSRQAQENLASLVQLEESLRS